ncbi:MAG: hypothetical protein MK212_22640 [Saprospiraceae bacterium]|nr:hypothetical protein [Saprospiraceae bacterium]
MYTQRICMVITGLSVILGLFLPWFYIESMPLHSWDLGAAFVLLLSIILVMVVISALMVIFDNRTVSVSYGSLFISSLCMAVVIGFSAYYWYSVSNILADWRNVEWNIGIGLYLTFIAAACNLIGAWIFSRNIKLRSSWHRENILDDW